MLKETVDERERILIPEQKPLIYGYHPYWWHGHGSKMKLQPQELDPSKVVLRSHAAEVAISQADYFMDGALGRMRFWNVDWKIQHWTPEDVQVNGKVQLTDADLRSAFGLDDTSDKYALPLIERYGGTCARPARYIRWRSFLNIPCPGTGYDGDPNVSIELIDSIKLAIATLVFSPAALPAKEQLLAYPDTTK